jgi:hypothetical protein
MSVQVLLLIAVGVVFVARLAWTLSGHANRRTGGR